MSETNAEAEWRANKVQLLASNAESDVAREISDRGRWFRHGLDSASQQVASRFTWGDVDLQREAARRHRRLARGCKRLDERVHHEAKATEYDSLGNRIAELLPPRDS
jgi:hypothetical protein